MIERRFHPENDPGEGARFQAEYDERFKTLINDALPPGDASRGRIVLRHGQSVNEAKRERRTDQRLERRNGF